MDSDVDGRGSYRDQASGTIRVKERLTVFSDSLSWKVSFSLVGSDRRIPPPEKQLNQVNYWIAGYQSDRATADDILRRTATLYMDRGEILSQWIMPFLN
jgi:hypothetical protein